MGSEAPEKYSAKGSDEMSANDSSVGCWSGLMLSSLFCEFEPEGSFWADAEADIEVEGSAVRMDGSNSRVLSNVRGAFSC